jgi:large subunit ribosomal protein L1
MVRSSVMLPNGTGKTKKVLVFAKGDSAQEAKNAGADFVGDADLIDKVLKGWLDFEAVVATPDMMKDISKLGRVLGTKGLMPSPKSGTVTTNVQKAVNDLKAGKVDFKVNKAGDINLPIGKMSFDANKICENAKAVIDAVLKAKPASSKGKYIKKLAISATMNHGFRIDVNQLAS